MLQTLGNISQLAALLLVLAAFITAFYILKEYKIYNIRFAKYFKLFLLQALIHSLWLALALFFADFKAAFIIHSFGIVPLYALLLFRRFYLNHKESARSEAIRTVSLPRKRRMPKIDPSKLKAIPKVRSGYNWR